MAELKIIRAFFFYRKLFLKTGHGSPCSSKAALKLRDQSFAVTIKRSKSKMEVEAETKPIAWEGKGLAV